MILYSKTGFKDFWYTKIINCIRQTKSESKICFNLILMLKKDCIKFDLKIIILFRDILSADPAQKLEIKVYYFLRT